MQGSIPAELAARGLKWVSTEEYNLDTYVEITFIFEGHTSDEPIEFGQRVFQEGNHTYCRFVTPINSWLHKRTEFWTAKFQELNQLIS